ncbi:hypothetical protein [Neisseria sp.]|uniref:hypothetical protein n=1 Tax=Neisseria sp. TaxID=192066 RepID=UPI0035A1A2F8
MTKILCSAKKIGVKTKRQQVGSHSFVRKNNGYAQCISTSVKGRLKHFQTALFYWVKTLI